MITHSIKTLLALPKAVQLHSRLERELLLAHALGVSRVLLYTDPTRIVLEAQKQQFEHFLERRLAGEPLAYLVGYQEFWSLPLKVSKAVLIPRPETELLVEIALRVRNEIHGVRVLDLGTGSGAIALALGMERPAWEIIAIDRSEAALAIARENAKNLAIQNVCFYQSHWFSEIESFKMTFDIIVSNPPYIKLGDLRLSEAVRQYEPEEALIAADNGFSDLQSIIANAQCHLAPEGWLIVEHGWEQQEYVKKNLQKTGFIEIAGFNDLAGLPRAVAGRTGLFKFSKCPPTL